MNRGLFNSLCKDVTLVHPDNAQELGELINRYPYFHAAHVLFSIALTRKEDHSLAEALKRAALHSPERRRLKELIEGKRVQAEVFVQTSDEPDTVEISLIESDHNLDVQKEEISSDLSLVEQPEISTELEIQDYVIPANVNNSESFLLEAGAGDAEIKEEEKIESPQSQHNFFSWLKQVNNQTQRGLSPPSPEALSAFSTVEKEELIERFIQTEPRISKPGKTEFYSPIIAAKKSVEDSEEIVSETLAKIFAQQGDVFKAIRIYKKLSLLNPEKRTYFAGLIKNLENSDPS